MPYPEPSPSGEGQDPNESIPVARVWQPPPVPPPPPPRPVAPLPPQYATEAAYGAYPQYGSTWTVATPYRPGTVTALGVMSIIVASLTFFCAGISAITGFAQLARTQMSRVMAASIARQQAAQQTAAAPRGLPAAERGLNATERDVAISVFAARQPLSNARQAQLDALLANAGQFILGAQSGGITSGVVRSAIRESSVGRSPRAGETGPSVFVTPSGTMEIYDDHAIFRPEDHSENVRAFADVNAYLVAHDDPAAVASAPGAPTPPIAPMTPAATTATVNAGGAMAMVMLEAALSVVLAIYLLVTGILTLRTSRAGAIMHWIYLPLKVLLVLLAFVAWSRFEEALNVVWSTGPTPPFGMRGSSSAALPTAMSVFALGYLILIAVLLLLPVTKDFYRKQA